MFSSQFQVIVHYFQEVKAARACSSRSHPVHSQEQREMSARMLSAQPAFSTLTQFRALCLGIGATHNGLSLPSSIKCPIDIPTGQPNADKPSLRLSFQVDESSHHRPDHLQRLPSGDSLLPPRLVTLRFHSLPLAEEQAVRGHFRFKLEH